MGFIIRQEEAWLQSRQSPVSKSTVPAQCQQRVSRFSIRCKVEFITSKRWLSSSIDLPNDSTRLASRSMELSFLFGCWSYCWDKVTRSGGGEGGPDILGGLHFTVLAREFLLFAGLAGSFAVAFLFSLATFFTCLRGRVSERRQKIEKKRGALSIRELTVAVRLAFCRGCAWLGVMGTAGYFAIRGPNTRGGGVDGSLQDEAALLALPNDSFAVCGKLSDMERLGVPVKVYMVWSGGRYPSST